MGIILGKIILILAGSILLTACGNRELDKDAKNIANAMCKNIEVMGKLRAADPADTTLIKKIQADAKQAQVEMTVLYTEFKDKYNEKAADEKFNKEFSKMLKKHMLECPHLSKEDRTQFEKDLEND